MAPSPHRRAARAIASVAALALAATACGTGPPSERVASLRGARLEVAAVWSGAEQERFERVLSAFERETGASVTYTSTGHDIAAVLERRIADGRPPDVALLPQPGLLRRFASEHHLVALDPLTAAEVRRNYAPVWRRLGTVGGRLYAVWFKAANKSLVWYDVGTFERAGVVPPDDLDGLEAAARSIADAGTPAFSVGGGDAWTLTDWFENLYLRLAGPAAYDLLAVHAIPWTDGTVVRTLQAMARLLAPDLVAGGLAGALRTTFDESVERAFTNPPGAAMVMEGDFVAGLVTGNTSADVGVDVDVFPFPPDGQPGPIVGGGDAAVLMRLSAAGDALLRFLATPRAAAVWAEEGGFISPNLNVDLTAYRDDTSRAMARSILEAGDDFRFDLSDLQPAAFGSVRDRGMRPILQEFLLGRDVAATAAALEGAATEAYGGVNA